MMEDENEVSFPSDRPRVEELVEFVIVPSESFAK
jgi:hypothetical protein